MKGKLEHADEQRHVSNVLQGFRSLALVVSLDDDLDEPSSQGTPLASWF